MKNINDVAFILQSRKGSTRVKNKMLRPFMDHLMVLLVLILLIPM